MSLKILINNEEVVCNSNIQINEEMLSTSSTILKNCYPKSWELDKDYVSRYYFPKDYSKCKIIDDVYHPEVIGTRVSGTNFTINYDNTLNWNLEELKGDTLQNGTPTPSSPVPIQCVTGLQNINVCAKNKLNIQTLVKGRLDNGVVGYESGTDEIIKNENSFSFTTNTNYRGAVSDFIEIDGGKTYYMSLGNSRTGIGMVCACYDENKVYISTPTTLSVNDKAVRYEIPSNAKYCRIGFQLNTAGTITITNPQFEENEITDYEPYKGNTYEVNLGKNLFDKSNATVGKNWNGDNMVYSIATNDYIPVEEGQSYVISVADMSAYSSTTIVRFDENKNVITPAITTNPFTIPTGTKYIKLSIRSATTHTWTQEELNNAKYQIEKGTQATSYSPYFTPIELNKIGDYEDSIKKSSGKNLFDKSTAIVGKNWNGDNLAYSIASDYIEVEEGKTYVISTTNMSSYSSTTVVKFDSNKNVVLPAITTNPFTVPEGIKYIKLSIRSATSHTWTQSELDNAQYQLEQNSQATSYEPYGKVWYVEKQIGKIILDGSETYETAGTNTSGKYKIRYADVINLIKKPANANTIGDIISNQFIPLSANDTYRCNQGISVEINGKISFYDETITQSTSSFTTWLANNNMTIKYVLATPTYTEITNTELIEQLESIELLKGTNNITITSENLPMIMQLYYNYKEAYTNEDLLFCGCVKNTGNISLNPREPHFVDLQVLDFKTLLSEGETLNYVITGKTIVEAINQVVNSISDYGFIVGNIQLLNPDEMIGAYSTLNKTAYDVFQYFADITQSRWTTRMIDENTIAIDFYDPTLMPQADPIMNTKEYMCSNKIDDISFNYSTNDYRNKQIMTSDEIIANITQTNTIVADGYATNFTCENKIGTITNMKVNGVNATFITKSEEELGLTATFIYQPGENNFNSSSTLLAGSIITITYYPIVKGREIILNSGESTRINEQINRNGNISRYENRQDATSSAELQKIGQSYIKYKGKAEINLKVKSEIDLFDIGQIVEYQAPLEELATNYMVKSKTIDWYVIPDKIFYTYELTSNFNYENAVNYFDNQRAKNQGNIGEGQTITRNIDLEATALIKFYDTDIEEIEVINPTSLDFALDGVII